MCECHAFFENVQKFNLDSENAKQKLKKKIFGSQILVSQLVPLNCLY